jgi:hypothetical protein
LGTNWKEIAKIKVEEGVDLGFVIKYSTSQCGIIGGTILLFNIV